MSRVHVYKCEVCGLQERDHSGWLLVSDQPEADNIDILEWDEKLAAQPGIRHLCCAAHLQALVGAWVKPDLGPSLPPEEIGEDPVRLFSSLNLDRACFSDGADRESLLAMLDVVEVVLQGSRSEDEEPTPVFDA